MIKVGIIGFGYMGQFHLNKMKQFDDVKAVCAFDNDESKLKDAKDAGMEAYDTLEKFIEQELDLVIIATPNQWHAQYAIACMQSGSHVLCEKPATMSVKELDEVIACSEETGKFFTVHQQRRFDSDYRAICEVINKGTIGNVTTIESRVLGERGVCFGWRAEPEYGGGMLYDWGVHLIDQILMLYPGEQVVSVNARILSILTPKVDDFFEITMMLSNGVCAKVIVGTFALQKLPRWFVFGDRGTMKLDNLCSTEGGIARIKGDVEGFDSVVGQKVIGPSRTMAPLKPEYLETIAVPEQENMDMEFWNNIVAAVKGEAVPYVTTEQIRRQMLIVEKAFEASKTNQTIKTSI